MRFDQATAVRPMSQEDPARQLWAAEIFDGWDIGGNANGGYLIAIAARAMQAAAGRNDVATITAHYLRPGKPGPITVKTEIVKSGRRFTTVSADLLDAEERPILRLLGSFTDLPDAGTPDPDDTTLVDAAPVELPPVEACVALSASGFAPPLMSRIEAFVHPDDAGFNDAPSGNALIRGWFGLLDDEPIDGLAVLLAADAMPPAVFNSGLPTAWVPTVELTVHVRRRPAPGRLRSEFRTRFITGGYLEEEGLVWDSAGDLVAQSRQLALLPRNDGPAIASNR